MTGPDPTEPASPDGPPTAQPADLAAADLIAIVSHELRSPLTSIKGYTALLLSRWDRIDDDEKQVMLARVDQAADRATRLVSDLLDVSRLEAGGLDLRRQRVDLPALVAGVIEQVAMASPALEATVTFSGDVAEVWADPDRIDQVLTNLIENAIRHAGPSGVQVSGETVEGGVMMSVVDDGEGIAPADVARLFDRFFRGGDGPPSGTGLGLWISRRLVESHGGHLTVTSTLGIGTTFCFTLPTAPAGAVDPGDHE